jgi:hypothetical protein
LIPASTVDVYACNVAKRGEKGLGKKLPKATLLRIASLVEALFEETGYTTREAEEKWGIDKATLNKTRHAEGAVGVHFLMKLRELVHQPIDEILGLSEIPAELRTKHSPAARRQAVAERAIEEAKKLGTPDIVIEYVMRNFVINIADETLRKEAYVRSFLRLWSLRNIVPPVTTPAQEWLQTHPEPPPDLEAEVEDAGDDESEDEPRRATG